ncbi:MAG TPA: hypothetical protein PLA54_00705 [Spirochaetota bacterium]|nr:hypothetical protein [Spirochaetota bacterium]
MRRFFMYGIIVLLSSNLVFSQNTKDNIAKAELILSDLKNVIVSGKSKKYDPVVSVVNFCFEEFRKKRLAINIYESLPENIYGGMQFMFYVNDSGQLPVILISPYMLEIYDKHPSIVLSALVHEMQHAKSYFDQPEFHRAMYNVDLEKYLFELDALNIEANFIINYLQPNNYKLTNFEKLLSKSFKDDYLAYFSFVMMGFDMKLTFQLLGINKHGVKYDDKISKIEEIINSLLESQVDSNSDDWNKYKYYVPIYTALKFIPQIVRSVETDHNRVKDQNNYNSETQNPKMYKLLLKLEEKFVKDYKYYQFINKTQNLYKEL